MLVVHGASRPPKILQDRYPAKLMARRRISYIAFKTGISFKKHMKRGAHLLAPGHDNVEGGFVSEFMFLLDWISVGGQSKQERDGSPM